MISITLFCLTLDYETASCSAVQQWLYLNVLYVNPARWKPPSLA